MTDTPAEALLRELVEAEDAGSDTWEVRGLVDRARALLGIPTKWGVEPFDLDKLFPTGFTLLDIPVVDGVATLPDGTTVRSRSRIVQVPVPNP